ncbi:protein translocase subunit SecF [Candidatus Binatia bacterium]|nr:protein translocase subunit SecF [Candidatus Binatia bacterium]
MEIIKPGTRIDFVSKMRIALLASGILILLSIAVLVKHGGPIYGVDFSGGTLIQLRFTEKTPIGEIREALASQGFGDATIQDFAGGGSEGEFLVRLPVSGEETTSFGAKVAEALKAKFGADKVEIMREEMVGPRVGSVLRRQALLSVLFATLMMGAYIWFRFDVRFGVGAATALAHDIIIATGVLTLFNYEFDLTIVAALLTIVGFSVNDTVIVSDRIRENLRKNRRDSLATVINRSINETLSRTILTTGTAVMVLLSLYLLGGNVINGFAFALLVGFVVGTYSSIFIASPIVLYFPERRT